MPLTGSLGAWRASMRHKLRIAKRNFVVSGTNVCTYICSVPFYSRWTLRAAGEAVLYSDNIAAAPHYCTRNRLRSWLCTPHPPPPVHIPAHNARVRNRKRCAKKPPRCQSCGSVTEPRHENLSGTNTHDGPLNINIGQIG